MSEVTELIERYGPSFCVLPWKHLDICEAGTCKACCATKALHNHDGRILNVYESSLNDIWNSDSIRDMRRAMVRGEVVPDCANLCISKEKSGTLTRRLWENRQWEIGRVAKEGLSIDDLKNDAVMNNFFIKYSPFTYALMPGTLCNLACRMCSPNFSTRVENDSVHNRWAKRTNILPTWKNNRLDLGPECLLYTTYRGFYDYAGFQKVETLWTKGSAEICLPHVNQFLDSVNIRIASQSRERRISIWANGELVWTNTNGQSTSQDIKVFLKKYYGELLLRFESDTEHSMQFNLPVGIGLERITIQRDINTIPSTELLSNRFPGKLHWTQEDSFLFGELFTYKVQPQNVSFAGGEPLINPNVLRTIKYLSAHGDPKKLFIYIATNGTVYNDEVLNLAKCFKLMNFGVSIDAIESGNEYIRYGSNWKIINKNLLRMLSFENISIRITSTLQAYNALEFSNLLRFCDQHKLINFANFVNYPYYLSINILPPSIRRIAAQRLQAYAEVEGGIPTNKQRASELARVIDSSKLPFEPKKLHEFMLFTNDLDRSRSQNIKETFPELVQLLEEAGYPWIDETRYWASPGE